MGVSRLLPAWINIFKGEVQPTSDVTLDRQPLTSFLSGRYIVEIQLPSTSKLLVIEVTSIKRSDNTVNDIAYNKIGESVDVEVNSEIDGSDVVLRITNNENSLVRLCVTKNNSKL